MPRSIIYIFLILLAATLGIVSYSVTPKAPEKPKMTQAQKEALFKQYEEDEKVQGERMKKAQ